MACGNLHDPLGPRFRSPGGHWTEFWSWALQHVMQLNQLMFQHTGSNQKAGNQHLKRTQLECGGEETQV